MKIVVRDSKQSTLGSINIDIKELGSELEKITVKVLSAASRSKTVRRIRVTSENDKAGDAGKTVKTAKKNPAMEIKITVPYLPLHKYLMKTERLLKLPVIYKILKRPVDAATQRMAPLRRWLNDLPFGIRAAGAIIVTAVLLIGVHNVFMNDGSKINTSASKRQALVHGNPGYTTVLPAGKTINDLGGWVRVSPQDRNPVYAYTDNVGGARVDVSEQPLPESFQSNLAVSLARLADSFDANGTLTAGGGTVYIGTSAKGPQSLILNKDNLLILIKSTSPLADKKWTAYIDSLQ